MNAGNQDRDRKESPKSAPAGPARFLGAIAAAAALVLCTAALAAETVLAPAQAAAPAAGKRVAPAASETAARAAANAAAPAAGKAAAGGGVEASFERIKELEGDWVMAGGDGSAAVTYRVTAAGSAVVETLFPGTAHEMVTVYHRDGHGLMMTHYCAEGNQPRMKSSPATGANEIHFKFAGASNLKSPKDLHMHEMMIRFVDADHIHHEWTSYKDGKAEESAKFDFARKTS